MGGTGRIGTVHVSTRLSAAYANNQWHRGSTSCEAHWGCWLPVMEVVLVVVFSVASCQPPNTTSNLCLQCLTTKNVQHGTSEHSSKLNLKVQEGGWEESLWSVVSHTPTNVSVTCVQNTKLNTLLNTNFVEVHMTVHVSLYVAKKSGEDQNNSQQCEVCWSTCADKQTQTRTQPQHPKRTLACLGPSLMCERSVKVTD